MDEIRRKLELIDARLSGRNLHGFLIRTAPSFFLAVGLMAGVLLQAGLYRLVGGVDRRVLLWSWTALLALAAGCLLAYGVRRRAGSRPQVLAHGALICFACLGAIRLLVFDTPAANDVRHLVGQQRRLATVRGRVLTDPHLETRRWCFAPLVHTDPASSFYMRVDAVETTPGWRDAGGTIRVRVAEPTPNVKSGDDIRLYCWLHRFEGPSNPGSFDVARYLRRRNVYVAAAVPSRDAIEVQRPARHTILTHLRRRLQNATSQALLGPATTDEPGEGLLQALLLGYRQDITPEIYEAFRRTGLLHLISLSGMHLGILIGLLWWACKTIGLLKPGRAVVCAIATAVFLLIVPPRAPTVRAAIIVWVYCLAVLVRRRGNAVNSLSLAAIILLLMRPTQLFEAGWQLSFAAVAGILVVTRRFARVHHRGTPASRAIHALGRRAMRLLAVGLAAWVGGAGIVLYHFYTITPLAAVWTVLVFPLVAAILVLGFLKIVLFFLLPTLSVLLGFVVSALVVCLIASVRFIAYVDVTHVLIGHVPLVLIVLYYAGVLAATFVRWPRPTMRNAICAAFALLMVVSLVVLKWQRTHRKHLSLTCLDVGHGQAIVARLPGTMNVLFDAGSLYRSDVGARTVVPFLDYIGIGRLNAIIISHGDIDHINGIPEIVDRRRVDHVYATGAFLAESGQAETIRLLCRHLASRHIEMERVPPTIEVGAVHLRALWPTAEETLDDDLSDNDKSLVSLIEYADTNILLCSDIEQYAQRQIMHLYPQLTTQVMTVPHHGSRKTLDGDFLTRLQPAYCLCSCSRQDDQRGRTIAEVGHTRLFRTAVSGAITLRVDPDGVITTTVHGTRAEHGAP